MYHSMPQQGITHLQRCAVNPRTSGRALWRAMISFLLSDVGELICLVKGGAVDQTKTF